MYFSCAPQNKDDFLAVEEAIHASSIFRPDHRVVVIIIKNTDVRLYLCQNEIRLLMPVHAEKSHGVTRLESIAVKLLERHYNNREQLTSYLRYVSIADLLHAKVLLVVFQGSIKVANSIHSMQESPCILHIITNVSSLSTQMLLCF